MISLKGDRKELAYNGSNCLRLMCERFAGRSVPTLWAWPEIRLAGTSCDVRRIPTLGGNRLLIIANSDSARMGAAASGGESEVIDGAEQEEYASFAVVV